jgi:hypothetical protein
METPKGPYQMLTPSPSPSGRAQITALAAAGPRLRLPLRPIHGPPNSASPSVDTTLTARPSSGQVATNLKLRAAAGALGGRGWLSRPVGRR